MTESIDVDVCVSFPGSGRTWLRAMFSSYGLNIPLAFSHGCLENKIFTIEPPPRVINNHPLVFHESIKKMIREAGSKDNYKINYKRVIFLWRNPFDILCSVNDKFLPRAKHPLLSNFKKDPWSTDKLRTNFKDILEYHIAVIEYCKQYNTPIYYLSYHDLLKKDTFIDLCYHLGYFNLEKIKFVYDEFTIDKIFKMPEHFLLEHKYEFKLNYGPDRDYRKHLSKEHINSLQEIISELDYNNKVAAKFNGNMATT